MVYPGRGAYLAIQLAIKLHILRQYCLRHVGLWLSDRMSVRTSPLIPRRSLCGILGALLMSVDNSDTIVRAGQATWHNVFFVFLISEQ